MKAWYSKVRDIELKDGSVRATYVVTFETDNAELKREVEKYLQGIMDRTDRKTEPQTDCTEALTLLWIKNMVTDEEFYRINARIKGE